MKNPRILVLAALAFAGTVQASDYLGPAQAVEGTVAPPAAQANLYVTGGTVVIEKPVSKDLYAAGREVRVAAPVGNNVHLAARKVGVGGRVSGDLIALAEELRLSPGSRLDGDLMAAGKYVQLEGSCRGQVRLLGDQVVLDGPIVGKSVVRYDHSLVLGPHCRLQEQLLCYGPQPPQVEAGAMVPNIDYRQKESIAVGFSRLSRWTEILGLPALLKLAAWLLAAWLLGEFFPKPLSTVLRMAEDRPLRDLGLGVILCLAVLAGVPLLLLTLVGAYVALTAGALFLAALVLARLLAVFYLGSLLRRLLGHPRAFPPFRWAAGSILLLHLSGGIPWVGCLIPWLLTLAPLGALARWGGEIRLGSTFSRGKSS